jgi:dTDP-4-dehydrorhamnose 3,5-epimerase
MPGLTIEPLAIADVLLVRQHFFQDSRGRFAETYRRDAFAAAGIDANFVQENQSLSVKTATVRGLHFQRPPAAQAKLVRVLRGSIFDVAVDLRAGSRTFGKWVGATLTASGGEQLFIPKGFAHGFCTLEPDVEVGYKCDAYYAPGAEGGLHYADPSLAIAWPAAAGSTIASDRDRALPYFANFRTPFVLIGAADDVAA